MEKHITSIEGLVDALGGTGPTAEFIGREDSAVSNWKARGFIPPGWHLRLFLELSRRGFTVAPSVFDLTEDDFADMTERNPRTEYQPCNSLRLASVPGR